MARFIDVSDLRTASNAKLYTPNTEILLGAMDVMNQQFVNSVVNSNDMFRQYVQETNNFYLSDTAIREAEMLAGDRLLLSNSGIRFTDVYSIPIGYEDIVLANPHIYKELSKNMVDGYGRTTKEIGPLEDNIIYNHYYSGYNDGDMLCDEFEDSSPIVQDQDFILGVESLWIAAIKELNNGDDPTEKIVR